MLEDGAELGRRTLHRAVEGAASASAERRGQKMEMIAFLIDELKVDVNAMDVPEGEQRPNHWGTPMAYAVPIRQGMGDDGAEVVRYLLEVRFGSVLCDDGHSLTRRISAEGCGSRD